MNRRQFIHAASATTVAAWATQTSANDADSPSREPPFLDAQRLEHRNRNRSTVVCQNGIVCASQPLATLAGVKMLEQGGNCVDAAIATNATLCVTEPQSNGLGGDLFAILWHQKEQRLYGLNASGRAPHAWDLAAAEELGLKEIPRLSPLSWSVPGCVSGWGALEERFGRLGLEACLQNAIEYAERGFPLSPLVARDFDFSAAEFPMLAAIYQPDDRVLRYGDLFRNPQLATSLRAIADEGPPAFYRGEIAERIVAKSKELGGRMEIRDLVDHHATWVEPVSSSYRGWDVWEIPPNGQGIAALQILNLLEQFDVAALAPNSAEHLHLFIEAKKLAFEDRAHYYADMQFANVPLEWLISKDYARQRAKLIDPHKASGRPAPGDPALDSDTVYLTAADREGNMISLIQSIYHRHGSTICPEGVGFPIQSRGQAFSLSPTHRNRLQPHKRPFHTIIPAFMTKDGQPVMSFGVMGGDFQPQGHAQVVVNIIDFRMSPQQAGDQPRVAHAGSSNPWTRIEEPLADGGWVQLERGFDLAIPRRLAEMGHRVSDQRSPHGGYQAIWREEQPRRYFGGSDPRKDGSAIGF